MVAVYSARTLVILGEKTTQCNPREIALVAGLSYLMSGVLCHCGQEFISAIREQRARLYIMVYWIKSL